MLTLEAQLKNPVWFALQETHQKYAVTYNGVRFYNPEICTFGAFLNPQNTKEASNTYIKRNNNFFYVSEHQNPIIDSTQITLEKKIEGCQMVLQKLPEVKLTEDIVLLDHTFINEIYNLIWLVMPGYYQKGGYKMGDYFGIIKDHKLVALAGQRMQTNLFTEISGVVTHPNYTRKGLAKQLIVHNTQTILKAGKTPILHTNKGNFAIPLYEKLGFKITRDMNWWSYKKKIIY